MHMEGWNYVIEWSLQQGEAEAGEKAGVGGWAEEGGWAGEGGEAGVWARAGDLSDRMAALRLRLQKEMFDVTEEQLLALSHVTSSQVSQ